MTEWNLFSRTLQVLTRKMSPQTLWRAAFASIIAGEVVMMLWVGRHQWYFYDEWRLVIERVIPHPHGPLGLFRQMFKPDGEHVIGLPLTFFVILVRWVGIGSYWPFVFVNIIVRVATLLALDQVCRRAGARRMVRLLAVASIAFFGEGYESLFGQSLMFAGFTMVFCLMAIRSSLSTDVTERRAAIASAVWLTLSILSSSYGFPVVAGVALFFVLTRRWRAGLVSFVVPPVVFVLVRVICGGSYAEQQPVSPGHLGLYIRFVEAGLGAVGNAITGMDGVGLAGFVALVALSLWLVDNDRSRAIVVSMLLAIVLFYFETSLSRSVFGAGEASNANRYTFFCGVLAIIMLAAAWGRRRVEPRVAGVAAVLVIVSLVNGVGYLVDGSAYYTDKMDVSRARLALGFQIFGRGLSTYAPDSEWAFDLTNTRLQALLDSPYDDGFAGESERCFQHWEQEINRAGVAIDSLPPEQHAALLVLLNEHSLGFGEPGDTLETLVTKAVQNQTNNIEIGQFIDPLAALATDPAADAEFVPITARCPQS